MYIISFCVVTLVSFGYLRIDTLLIRVDIVMAPSWDRVGTVIGTVFIRDGIRECVKGALDLNLSTQFTAIL